jgi:uncharacterized protein involved in type VI secretion and phage assembly
MMMESDYIERAATGPGGLFYGVYPALVIDLNDPDKQGRVRVRLPWSPDGQNSKYEAWARLATLMAGNNRGTWFVPDVNDEVLVAFEAGNPRRPYVVGALWNGKDAPPERMDTANNIKSIHSRQGVRITLDDTLGATKLRQETPGGHSVTLSDEDRSIVIKDSNGNSIKLGPEGITLTAGTRQLQVEAGNTMVNVEALQIKAADTTVTVEALQLEAGDTTIAVEALQLEAVDTTITAGALQIEAGDTMITAGALQIESAFTEIVGIVHCDMLLTESVVSPTYTPGLGNLV